MKPMNALSRLSFNRKVAALLFWSFHASVVVNQAQTTGRYGHMFPAAAPPDAEYLEKLKILGRSLLDAEEAEPCDCPPSRKDAGYTYFGQLIDHDLTFDPIRLEHAQYWSAEGIENGRTPWLDLDQVYGGGPERSRELYYGPKEAARFRIEKNCDLPKGGIYKLLGDQCLPIKKRDFRDLENAILLQLHVLFMRLHNAAIDQNLSCGIRELDKLDKTRFKKAARLVRWQYQRLVRDDFLKQVIEPEILSAVRRTGPCYTWERRKFFIPIEFSTAAFRFGHSAVREKYTLNRFDPVDVGDVINPNFATAPLPRNKVIDWRHFFQPDWDPSDIEVATMNGIDTKIAPALGDLKQYTVRSFSHDPMLELSKRDDKADPAELPVRTLLRGAWMQVACTQTIISSLCMEQYKLNDDQLVGKTRCRGAQPDKAGKALLEQGLLKDPPLFYYVLREAEVVGCGNQLGPVGSRIVVDVIEGALRFDPNSYWKVRETWRPPKWKFPDGKTRRIETMGDLIALVGQ